MPITICDDSERFRKATAGGLLAFRSHPNERGTERGESVLCLCACAVATVVRARLRTALIEGHLAIVNPLFVARLAAEPLLGGAGRLEDARFAIGMRAGRKKSQRRPCNHKKPGTPTQIPGRTISETAAHGFLLIRSAHAPTLLLRARPRLLPNAQQLGGTVSSCLFPEMPSNAPDLFALDVRGFEDRPPLLNLSLVVGGERLRILILARRNFLAEIGEPLAHAGIR
jgi:hypothetical protein